MDFLWHLLFLIGNWIPLTLGYNLVFGKGKILHFGPIGVGVASAYATFLMIIATNSFVLGLLAGLVTALALSALFAWLSFRLDSDGLGVMSIAVHLAFLSVVLNWQSLTRGSLGIPRIPRLPFLDSPAHFALAQLAVAALWIILFVLLDRSAYGRRMAALAEHEWHASALGIDRHWTHLVAFLLLGVAITGDNFFFTQYLQLLHPSNYEFPSFIFLLAIIVAGGSGRVLGTVLATSLFVLLKEGLRFLPLPLGILGPLRLLLFGIILFVAVWVRRDSLFPQKRTV